MSDIIDRQAAIDAIERNAYRHTYIDQIVDVIKDLPSAQPTQSNDSNTLNALDCISRQAAIDAIDSLYFDTVDDHDRAKERIKRLPSAQPERQIELVGTESNIEILSELRAQFNCFDEVEEPCYRALSDAICALSAQPEVRTQMSPADCISRQAAIDAVHDEFGEGFNAGANWMLKEIARQIAEATSKKIDEDFSKFMNAPEDDGGKER